MAADPFDKFNSVDPTAGQETQVATETATPENNTVVETAGQVTETTPPAQVDQFFETFNKRFGTQYKADDELKPLFDLPKKVKEYEEKVKDRDELAKSVDQYKRDLETLRVSEASKYLSHPLMQKAYIAKQMQEKYPDKDPFVLQEIAMSDVSKMDNIEAIAKEKKINFPDLSLEDIKAVILNDLNIDPEKDPKEWDSLTQAKVRMRGAEAKANIKRLTEGIELPKIETAEEAKKKADENLAKMTEKVAPFKAKFSQYDKVKIREDLDYTVPDDFKQKLPDMFDRFILKAGIEPTEENIKTLEDIREAFFFSANKDKIYEAMFKDAEAKLKKQEDIENGNTQPPNTATASDQAGEVKPTEPGHDDFRKDIQGQRVRHLK